MFIAFFSAAVSEKRREEEEARMLALRLLKKAGFQNMAEAKSWQEAVSLSGGCPLVGIGNIKGQAYDMIIHYEGGEQN